MKTLELSCREVGENCDYVCHGGTEKELFDDARRHGSQAHGMKEIPPDLVEKARKLIKVVESPPSY